jgi:hypothetical protein
MLTEDKASLRRKQIPIGLDPSLRQKVERLAEAQGVPLAEVIRRAVLKYDGTV